MAWVDHRARREPALAAYVLAGLAGPGIDERRRALAPVAPRILARGLRGLDDAVSWQLRSQLRALAPHEVAFSLDGPAALADEAWALRRELLRGGAGRGRRQPATAGRRGGLAAARAPVADRARRR